MHGLLVIDGSIDGRIQRSSGVTGRAAAVTRPDSNMTAGLHTVLSSCTLAFKSCDKGFFEFFSCFMDSGPLSEKSAGHMQNRKTKTNTNPSPDPNRYRRRCPDPNAKFIHYMAIATFAIADLCDSGLSPFYRP